MPTNVGSARAVALRTKLRMHRHVCIGNVGQHTPTLETVPTLRANSNSLHETVKFLLYKTNGQENANSLVTTANFLHQTATAVITSTRLCLNNLVGVDLGVSNKFELSRFEMTA